MSYEPTVLFGESLAQSVYAELLRIAEEFEAAREVVVLQELHAPPARLQEGMIVFADGTDWEPVATQGKGIYAYYGGSWKKLG